MNTDAIKGFQDVQQRLRSETLRKNIGVRLVELFKRHLGELESNRPNKQGFPRKHFWGGAAKATNYRITPGGLQIVVSQEGFAQRVYGGIIRPVNAKALTIPLVPEAYGKSAKTIPDLYFVAIHKGNVIGMLVQRNLKRVNNRRGLITGFGPQYEVGTAFFLLIRQATQRPDPSLVPTEAQINTAIVTSTDKYLARR